MLCVFDKVAKRISRCWLTLSTLQARVTSDRRLGEGRRAVAQAASDYKDCSLRTSLYTAAISRTPVLLVMASLWCHGSSLRVITFCHSPDNLDVPCERGGRGMASPRRVALSANLRKAHSPNRHRRRVYLIDDAARLWSTARALGYVAYILAPLSHTLYAPIAEGVSVDLSYLRFYNAKVSASRTA